MRPTNDRPFRLAAATLAGFALVSFGWTAPAAAKTRVKIKSALVATAAAPGAGGKLRFELRGTDNGRFEVVAKKLDRDASYEVVVGGVKVGSLATNGGGGGRLHLRSRPHGSDHMLGFDPRGATVTVREEGGDDVLTGTIADDGSGTPDAGDVICCIPDDSGAECEDRSAAECVAQGGSVSDATSCLPNPCAGAPIPGVDIVCCIPDDSGPECEDRTVEECATQGGTVVDATSCVGNPCAATPSPSPSPGAGGNEPGGDDGHHGGHGGHGADD